MRIENGADHQSVVAWVGQFPTDELTANGWVPADLVKLTQAYPSLFLFEKTSIAAGLIYQQIDKNHFEVLYLGTIPSLRRRGLQEILLKHFSKLHPNSKLWLECRGDNDAALALYKKSGFAVTGRRPNYYKDGMDAVLMEVIFPSDN